MSSLRPHPHTLELPVYEPGKPLDAVAREFGFDSAASLIKLASNENALGPSPQSVAAMRAAAPRMHLYPDGGAMALRQSVARHLGVAPGQLIFSNGSNELIELLGHVFLGPGVNLVTGSQAFIVYKLVARAFQATCRETPMPDLGFDVSALLAAVDADTRLVFVANPNNPTGSRLPNAELRRLVDGVPPHALVVIDEAYIELLDPAEAPDTLDWLSDHPNLMILRTFSKAYGLAGLRLGMAIGHPEVIGWLERFRQPFNVNAMAQAAALAALEDREHLAASRRLVSDGLAAWNAWCDARGLRRVPSAANFLLVETGRGRERFQALQALGVIVRPMDVYGLPDMVRISIGLASENQRAMDALDQVLGRKDGAA